MLKKSHRSLGVALKFTQLWSYSLQYRRNRYTTTRTYNKTFKFNWD